MTEQITTTDAYQIGALEEKWDNIGPDDFAMSSAAEHAYDLASSDSPLFWFLKKFNTTTDPLTSFFWGDYSRLHRLEYVSERKALGFSEKGPACRFAYTTEGSIPSDKLNEDFLLISPFGKNRFIAAVFDGASSQKPIEGLEKWKVSGAFYISHLAGMGFPMSDEFRALADNKNANASDVVSSLNTWLRKGLEKVPGVNYQDVLTIPGMAATIAIIDLEKNKISIAHIADTIAIAEYGNSYKVLTDNKNEKFDQETLDLVQKIAEERKIPLREAAGDSRVKDQLKASFRKKINSPGGCGILNGMPELISNDLVQVIEIPITKDLRKLHLGSDGFYAPYLGNIDFSDVFQTRKLLGAAEIGELGARGQNALDFTADQLDMDPDFEKIPRLKRKDDATYLGIGFGKPQTDWALHNQILADLFSSEDA